MVFEQALDVLRKYITDLMLTNAQIIHVQLYRIQTAFFLIAGSTEEYQNCKRHI